MKIADESLVFPKRLSAYFLAVKESIRDDPALSRLLERARLDLDVGKYPDNWNGGRIHINGGADLWMFFVG